MSTELTTERSGALTAALRQQGVGELLEPLTREIHLFDSYVAGTTFLKDPKILKELKPGIDLSLHREDNIFDENAILLVDPEGRKVGYVPEKDNLIFARLMDAGKFLTAKVLDIETRGDFLKISIAIYLMDF